MEPNDNLGQSERDSAHDAAVPARTDATAMQMLEQKADELIQWITDKAISGVPSLSSAEQLADEYKTRPGFGSDDDRVDSLIKWECSKNFASGFFTGLGGVVTIPFSIPTALGASWLIQTRMSAAIARIYGHNLHDDKVRTFVVLTLLGNEAAGLLKEVGVTVGNKLTLEVIKRIPIKSITSINKLVGFRLLSKVSQQGVVDLTKLVPVAGGVVGGTFDLVACQAVGRIAKKVFRPVDGSPPPSPTTS
ncbi:MAG TPA: EcsC family protein [Pirellulales bacterium]|nr:EcsC family protein [Pirellulales bacterium]